MLMPCEIEVKNQVVRGFVKGIKNPWIKAGPQCPANLHVVEGPLRPRCALERNGEVSIGINAYYDPLPEPMMLPPADGYFEIVERDEADGVHEKVFDEKKTRLASLANDKMLIYRQKDFLLTQHGEQNPCATLRSAAPDATENEFKGLKFMVNDTELKKPSELQQFIETQWKKGEKILRVHVKPATSPTVEPGS